MSPGNATTTVLRPEDVPAVRDAVLDAPGRIAIAGAGTAADWAGRLEAVDAVLDTTGLTGVITHNPGDMTVSVRAGTPLRALADELAPHGQHVAFDAARVAEGATVGGLVATGDAGPAALRYGSLRDLVIGATVVLADGTIARSGGHVIKNVAGYDLTKLLHGSYGTLAVLVEVVLRLHPVPERTATVVLEVPLAEAVEHAARVLGGPFEPVALEWVDTDGTGQLLVRIEGAASALDTRTQRLRTLLHCPEPNERHCQVNEPAGAHLHPSWRPEAMGDSRPIGSDERAVRSADPWGWHGRVVRGAPDAAVLRIGVRPSVLPGLLGALPLAVVTAGLGTGVATVALAPDAVAHAHALVHAAGGTSVLRARPPGSDVPAWGPAPSALAVLKAVKTELDPRGRLGPGRFAPWM